MMSLRLAATGLAALHAGTAPCPSLEAVARRVLNDMARIYADMAGSVITAQMAVEDFGG